MQSHVTVNISPATFAANVRHLRQRVQPAKLCVVMKADAYGHGFEALAPVAVQAGADYIGVCTNPEAEVVRRLDSDIPVLRLRSALPDEYEESARSLHLEEQVGSQHVADYVNDLGRRRGNPVPVHIKIDTGMGRSGFRTGEIETIKGVCSLKGLRVVGIMTRLANADDVDLASTHRQLETFWTLRNALDGYTSSWASMRTSTTTSHRHCWP